MQAHYYPFYNLKSIGKECMSGSLKGKEMRCNNNIITHTYKLKQTTTKDKSSKQFEGERTVFYQHDLRRAKTCAEKADARRLSRSKARVV